ncbi:unnamed protein product [Cladocopium goreaui]|uniref:Reticulocyte-binding protein 2-like a n=1 Tax=Cladocopium goreaui TaxID=2562237 RepID=A0A9P1CY89_9DINO|nr:unnamed protein product [Cladocopium goreaui]
MANEVTQKADQFEDLYSKLLKIQHKAKDELTALMVQCTQTDVACNYLLVRSRIELEWRQDVNAMTIKAKKQAEPKASSERVPLRDRKRGEFNASKKDPESELACELLHDYVSGAASVPNRGGLVACATYECMGESPLECSVSLSFYMVMKEEDNVDDHLWLKAGSHAFRSKDLAASAVVLLCKLGHFQGRCLNSRLATAYAEFTAWVGRSKKTTGIDWWSKLKLDMASDNDWPTSLGSSNGKACDTALVLGWLEEFLGTIECARNDLLQGLKVAVVSSNAFFRNMRACGLWVTEPHRAVVLAAAKSMCEAYGYLASKCFTMRMKLFRLRPKIHFQQHITMLLNLGDVGFSALNFSCWSDEDYIGRVSRLSRTCHPRTMALRCLEKALVLYSIQFKKIR